ncbi:hypothetical protein N7510_004619 [Penicillium lagena]|uniref:uncharacterized protein n=1 Tax=Penicillium lagena TaxID=94218 RepID=UPI00253FC225|nr:uncharacterized protein N7510_004619 [Penicillium lagena]KAJ5620635.1 hypothetical protein N7510_004619 [Penicillium lagena]
MSRPQMIRADTLDLQDHDAPSAKDHSKQPEQPAPLGAGRPAPHQELSLRNAEHDSKSELRSANGVDIYGEPEDMEDEMNGTQYDQEDGDLADGESDDLLDDDLMDKISSSPSIDDEDIDFEFVYALHNFVATVDGQANAAKGDTMVLLDDSNSYWWLVRVVKDGSIGYLPAEHIETPTERLARLNKHRNVDLSATMLGDNSEKSKNPLKKAMRRRNAKTVNFAAPTYIEASDVEFSSDDDSEHGDFFDDETLDGEEDDAQEQEDIVVEPLRPKGHKEKPTEQTEVNGTQEKHEPEIRSSSEPRRSSEEFFDSDEPTVSRSRNGTVRNTDSFFKDDTAEPKKISLTPNLLRDVRDESNSMGLSNDWKEGRGSSESTERTSVSGDKIKDDKKRKEKKPGMLSGLFKRKDKKSKSSMDDDFDEPLQSPAESSFRASPVSKTSMESISSETRSSSKQGVQRESSKKLQKQPPAGVSPTKADAPRDPSMETARDATRSTNDQSVRQVTSPNDGETRRTMVSPASQSSPFKEEFVTPTESFHPLSSPIERPSSEAQVRPYFALDGTILQTSGTSPPQKSVPKLVTEPVSDRPESPVVVSPVETEILIGGPGPTMEASSQRTHSISPISEPSSPEVEKNYLKGTEPAPGSFDTLSVDTPTWSDASLRSYLDEENDIRDLFIIVHDKSNIPPAGPDHPITGRLFKDESKRLKEMSTQLDDMLVNWMSQRNRNSTPMRPLQSPPV